MEQYRSDFPILNTYVHGKPLVYLDNASTTQKPVQVLRRIEEYYTEQNSNIHRGVHYLSSKATQEVEDARCYIAARFNAKSACEIIFTKGTTESINVAAHCFGKAFVNPGDEVVITEIEHHANIVPWQMMCEERQAVLRVIPIDQSGVIRLDEMQRIINPKTKVVAITYASNVLGTVQPFKEVIDTAHKNGAVVLLDGAQAVSHYDIDLQDIDCDFFAFSAHKAYSAMGVGVLYGKEELLNAMPPFLFGGDMVDKVTFEKTTFNKLPFKFEAGTLDIGGILTMKRAFEYIDNIGIRQIADYEHQLLVQATEGLAAIPDIELYGLANPKTSVLSFNLKGISSFDVGVILDNLGVAVRTGHHCAQPLMNVLGVNGTVRASMAFYNTHSEIETLIKGVERARKMLL